MQYWLKVAGTGTDPLGSDWYGRWAGWVRRYGEVSMFSRRPRITTGDRLVLYAAGSPGMFGAGRIYGVDAVTSVPEPSPHERWPWMVRTHLELAGPLLEKCPTIDSIGVRPMSV